MARSAMRMNISVHHWRRKLQHERPRLSVGDRETLRAIAQLAKDVRIVRRSLVELLERYRVIVASGHSELESAVQGRTCSKDAIRPGPPFCILRKDQHEVVARGGAVRVHHRA